MNYKNIEKKKINKNHFEMRKNIKYSFYYNNKNIN